MLENQKELFEELKNTIIIKKDMVAKKNAEEEKQKELRRIAALPENVAKREVEKIDENFNTRVLNLIDQLNKKINDETWHENFEVETYFPMSSNTSDDATTIVVSILKEKTTYLLKELLEDIKIDICFEKQDIYGEDSEDSFFSSGKLLYSYNNVVLKLSISF